MSSDLLRRQLAVMVIIGKNRQAGGKGQGDARLRGLDLDLSDCLVRTEILDHRPAKNPGQEQRDARGHALDAAQYLPQPRLTNAHPSPTWRGAATCLVAALPSRAFAAVRFSFAWC